jgi:hypothetical protein
MKAGKDFDLSNDGLILQMNSPMDQVVGPYAIVYKNIDERVVIVALDFKDRPCFGFHIYTGELGFPSSRGQSTWHIIPLAQSYELLECLLSESERAQLFESFLKGKTNGPELQSILCLHLTVKEEQKIKQILNRLCQGTCEQNGAETAYGEIKKIEHEAKKRN